MAALASNTTSSLGIELTLTIAAGGTNYVVGDILTIVQSGASGGTAKVSSITEGGVVATLTFLTGGKLYGIANTLATTTNSVAGADCTLNITAVTFVGNLSRTNAKKFVLFAQYVVGNGSAVTLTISFRKRAISATTNFRSSVTDTATVAQQVFTVTGTMNAAIPITVPASASDIVILPSGDGTTGTLVLDGYPDLA
jgi:hypothetical protein